MTNLPANESPCSRLRRIWGFTPAGDPLFAPALVLAVTLIALPVSMMLPLQIDQSLQLLIAPAWLLLSRRKTNGDTPVSDWDQRLMLAFAGLTIISICFSPQSARAAVAAAALWWTLAAAMTARPLAQNPAAVRLVLAALALSAAIGVVVVRAGHERGWPMIPFYTHSRIFGMHMLAGSVASLGWFLLVRDSRPAKVMAALIAGVVWTGLAWSGSRAPVLGLGVALIVWFYTSSKPERIQLALAGIGLGITAMTTSWLLGPTYGEGWWTALHRTVSAGTDLNALSSTRSDFWTVVWHRVIGSPWIGSGGDAYLFMHPRQVGNQPHNFLLQWLLEYGVLGTLPLLLLLAGRLFGGGRSAGTSATIRVAFAGLTGVTVCALFDGVFYHVIIAIPAAIFAGLCVGPLRNDGIIATTRWTKNALRVGLTAGAFILVLHNTLALALTHSRPASPDALVARTLRIFPSETFGLWNWLNTWKPDNPAAALEWAEWAQTHAVSPAWFHLYAAQCHWEQGDPKAALKEVDEGLETAASKIEKSELTRFKTALENHLARR